jgi:uncharacterized protein DUF2442
MFMTTYKRPRIQGVYAECHGLFVVVTWDDGAKNRIDLTDMIVNFKVFASLRSGDLFRTVRVGEYGWNIVWSHDVDMSADTLWRLSQEQAEEKALA